MDILPAFPDPITGPNCLIVPDRQSMSWRPSNPKGFAKWFEDRCELVSTAEVTRVLARAEPVPLQQGLDEKETLKKAVQLLKRWRDIRFQQKPAVAPISMVLTTLAGELYAGEVSLARTMTGVLKGIVSRIETCNPRIYVLNPGNPQEDLSERWDDRRNYREFLDGILEFNNAWEVIVRTRSLPGLCESLQNLFGAPVQAALAKQARRIQQLRESSSLRIGSAGVISSSIAKAAGIPLRGNTFHGKK